MTLDLSLPATCPALCIYEDYSRDLAKFALYTLTDISTEDLSNLLTILNKEWMTMDEEPLVRTPKDYNFAGKTLKDVVQAHVDLDKEITLCSGGMAKGNIGWYPTAFLVVTTQNWADEGLLCVFMDDTCDDEGQCADPDVRRMDKFFMGVGPDDAPSLLPSLSLHDLWFVDVKEQYGLEQGQYRTGRSDCENDGNESTEAEPAKREEDADTTAGPAECKEDIDITAEPAEREEGVEIGGHYRLSNGEVVHFPGGASVGDEVLLPTFARPSGGGRLEVRVDHIVEEVADYDSEEI